jgi:hypothetical protein
VSKDSLIRWGWLKAMYIYTIVVSAGVGLGMVLVPGTVQSLFRFPSQDPVMFALCGSLFFALGFGSILGLRSPLKFTPVLLLELVYKPVWLAAAALPLFMKGQFPFYVVFTSVVFVTFIIGDLLAIPFPYLLSKEH